MGTTGTVTAENSAVGTSSNDYISATKVLATGNYLVTSQSWNNNRGAVRFCLGVTGCSGALSAENSLVGATTVDSLGFNNGITLFSNGNYLVVGRNSTRGSVTFGSGVSGVTGEVSASNSLVGRIDNDGVGSAPGGSSAITLLANNNYIVLSRSWHNSQGLTRGAATLCDGVNGTTGFVTEENSLIGGEDGTFSDSRVTALANGNYVVSCPTWGPSPIPNRGAVTFCNGTTGTIGVVTEANSFVGDGVNNSLGQGVRALSNGNYVIFCDGWNSSRGAVIWADGNVGIVGTVNASNSLTGTQSGDGGFLRVAPLTNGNYVVSYPNWSNGSLFEVGASAFCNGATGLTGQISAQNSLIGTHSQDTVGMTGVLTLSNGNYLVISGDWNQDRGALTWGNGTTGLIGSVSSMNSLVGSDVNQGIGASVLPNGNYLFFSSNWGGNRGIVGLANGSTGVSGVLAESYGLTGNIAEDRIGSGGITTYEDGYFVIFSPGYDDGTMVDAGALTFGKIDRPITGRITPQNSVTGYTRFTFGPSVVYDHVNKQFIVARNGGVSIVRLAEAPTDFDFDGDSRSDISIFRPSTGAWYLQRSRDGLYGAEFGFASDKLAPADYDGDGKADIAVYRPETGIW
jgi:hypothetical protein